MTTARRHAWRAQKQNHKGFVLIGLIALLAMGALYFFVGNLSPENQRERAQQQTGDALMQAREALIGYALRYREDQINDGQLDRVYGYLPLPDLGSTRNNNGTDPDCYLKEGCESQNFLGNAINNTVIGRFPWRTLGTGPLKDSNGECLWYAISGSHQRQQRVTPMNWDTLSQLDVVVANGTAAMASAIASAHERPIAVIFSPGPPLSGQDRSTSATDTVTECGGNYEVSNYLDPKVTTDLVDVTNYFAAGTNSASGDTSGADKKLSAAGLVNRRSDATLWAGNCPSGSSASCSLVANDSGVGITSDMLFRSLRGSSFFRTDINSMHDRMVDCLRDKIAAGTGFTPDALSGFTAPTDKTVGRIPSSDCYDDAQNPLGYFSHYQDHFFIASKIASDFTVTDTKNTASVTDDTSDACAAALIFAGQRGSGQSRANTAERNTPANYLEGINLTSFSPPDGNFSFTGPTTLTQVSTSQTVSQDIVRCIPSSASLTVAAPVVAAAAGDIQLAAYVPGTRVLTLGSGETTSNYGAAAASLSACAWTPEVQAAGSGFRSYFRFRIRRVGEGFTFAVIDGDRNGANACGAARQHLGYSGDSGNASFPYIQWPKLAIEFDTSRQCNSPTFDSAGRPACAFIEHDSTNTLTLRNGRNDPCYTSGCWTGSPMPPPHNGNDNSSHVAVVYWGYGSALNYPTQDDNAHDQLGLPMPTDPSSRPGPRNPAPVLPYLGPPTYPDPTPTPGIAPLDRMGKADMSQREFHARIEVTRTFTAPVDAKDGTTGVQVKFWIEPHSAKSISAMTYNAGSPPTLTVTVTPVDGVGHGLSTGDTVVIKDVVPAGYNGEYPVTVVNSTRFTATLPAGTPDPGPYISSITWTDYFFSTDRAFVTSANHGLNDWDTVTISGAVPAEYNGTRTIRWLSSNSYYFGLELNYEPGSMAPAIAAPKALTPLAVKLANTTRPMSELDATAKAYLSDTATIYDEQKSACAASAPLCPNGQSCGSDNMCYRPAFRNLRLGFTVAERPTTSLTTSRDQLIEITDRATTWLP